MSNKRQTYKDKPVEVGKTYRTKMQTGETFTVSRIDWKKAPAPDGKGVVDSDVPTMFHGTYSTYPDTVCPIHVDRLIPERDVTGYELVCGKCGHTLDK